MEAYFIGGCVGFGLCLVLCMAWYHGHLKQQIQDLKDHVTASATAGGATLADKAKAILDKATADIAALGK